MTRDEIALKIFCSFIQKYGDDFKQDRLDGLIDHFIKLVDERKKKSEYRKLIETIRDLANNRNMPQSMQLMSIRSVIQSEKHVWEEL